MGSATSGVFGSGVFGSFRFGIGYVDTTEAETLDIAETVIAAYTGSVASCIQITCQLDYPKDWAIASELDYPKDVTVPCRLRCG